MNQAPSIKTKNLHVTFNFFAAEEPQATVTQFAAGLAELVPGMKPAPPAIGEIWPGQGGIYGGLRLYPEGMCHVIFAEADAGKHAFGDYGTEVDGTNQVDGRANSALLLAREGKHPAAIAAAGYTADGHSDFYLPASGELHHGYLYLPQAFEMAWYVSSSQRSADYAYYVDFEDGWLFNGLKDYECFVRPVRRFLQ